MVKIVVDTSVIIDGIRRGDGWWFDLQDKAIRGEVSLLCPVVVLTELWAGKSMAQSRAVKAMKQMLSVTEKKNITIEMAVEAGNIIRNYGLIGFDAIIAAMTIVSGAELATLNAKHFEKVKGLKLCTFPGNRAK